MSCESWDSNAKYDVLSKPIQGNLLDPITCYLGEHMEKYLTHPYASPLFGNFSGLPPMLIQAGDAEVLRDEVTLLAYKASLAGVKVRHELYEDGVSVHTQPQPLCLNQLTSFGRLSLHRSMCSIPTRFWRSPAGRSCHVANS